MATDGDTTSTDFSFKLASFNIHFWTDAHGRPSLSRQAQTILESGADVVGLQEVYHYQAFSPLFEDPKKAVRLDWPTASTDPKHRDRDVSCLEALAAVTGLTHFAFGGVWEEAEPGEARYGNAILSRFPIVAQEEKILQVEGAEPRGLLMTVLDTPGGLVRVHCVHLDHMLEPARLKQLAAVEEALSSTPTPELRGSPHVLVGDFNSLCRLDYNDLKWADVARVRRQTKWEAPHTDVTKRLMGEYKNGGLEYKDALRHGSPEIAERGVKSTCAFNTRIDYLLLSEADSPVFVPPSLSLPSSSSSSAGGGAGAGAGSSLSMPRLGFVPESYFRLGTSSSDHALVSVDVSVSASRDGRKK